jgi:hypothetical protein
MLNARPFVLLMILLLLLSALGRPSEAWEYGAHLLITADAIGKLPEPLRAKLQGELAAVWPPAVLEPDSTHAESGYKLHLSALRGTPPDGGDADRELERFARKAEAMIASDESLRGIVFGLGQAARVIQDLNVPLHTVWGETAEQHATYESHAYFHDWPGDRHGYRGFHLIQSYKCFAVATARRSHASVDRALWTKPPRRLIEEMWDSAVNDTINLWLSIFYRALGPEKSHERHGISPPLGEIGRESDC